MLNWGGNETLLVKDAKEAADGRLIWRRSEDAGDSLSRSDAAKFKDARVVANRVISHERRREHDGFLIIDIRFDLCIAGLRGITVGVKRKAGGIGQKLEGGIQRDGMPLGADRIKARPTASTQNRIFVKYASEHDEQFAPAKSGRGVGSAVYQSFQRVMCDVAARTLAGLHHVRTAFKAGGVDGDVSSLCHLWIDFA